MDPTPELDAPQANRTEAPPPLLTLREAARLTGLRRRALRDRVRRGQVAVRVVAKGRSTKLRLTPDALAAAGLLPSPPPAAPPPAPPPDPTATALLDLLREQGARVATLEEQRFQLAGQLGAALERVRALEDQLLALASGPDLPATAPPSASPPTAPRPQPAPSLGRNPHASSPAHPPPARLAPSRRTPLPIHIVALIGRRASTLASARRPTTSATPQDPTPNT